MIVVQSLTVLEGHENEVKCVTWAPSGNLLATCSRDKSVWIWEVRRRVSVTVFKRQTCGVASNTRAVGFSQLRQQHLHLQRRGRRLGVLASSSDDRTVKIWKEFPGEAAHGDLSWKCVCTLSGFHTRTVYDVAWCKLTGALATACGDDGVRVFKEDESSDRDQPIFSLAAQVKKAHDQDVNCVAWNPQEAGLLATCSDDGDIAIWRFQEEE
ncbi:putative cytosolic iron-sulfur protein assembly protein CIAO1 [Solea senegalensis]|uniref:Cytosolic iron-sulfur protein assembly protein CIAO1 n=1 Tax=Solea senegalensis TaxID=28829 RepID=A0AAV6QEJ7_SOLSE|nr:putative cytosolic iron-sulfur protein assembly protein CIAO1 [Solea senegalensis]